MTLEPVGHELGDHMRVILCHKFWVLKQQESDIVPKDIRIEKVIVLVQVLDLNIFVQNQLHFLIY